MSNTKKENAKDKENASLEDKDNKVSERNYIKNYFILFVVFAFCIGFAFYLRKQYEVYEQYQLEIPIIGDSLPNINRDDLEHYVFDNHIVAVYMCTASSDACRNFEKSFKRYVEKSNITDEIVYLNLSDDIDLSFINYFNEKFPFKTKLKGNYPAFVIFRDGEVDSMLQGSTKKNLSISKVETFLELNLFYEEEEEDTIEKEDSLNIQSNN